MEGCVVATLLWDANERSNQFSRCYDESWVTKLYDGFARNLTDPFRFTLFTDRPRDIPRPITQVLLESKETGYARCIEPYRLDEPMILCGLDTVVVGNCDHLSDYCLKQTQIALPADPYNVSEVCNGVALVPAGHRRVFDDWNGENDMEWMRAQPHKVLDLVFPGHVVSYKGDVKHYGLRDSRIVYFHGDEKPHQLDDDWIKAHW